MVSSCQESKQAKAVRFNEAQVEKCLERKVLSICEGINLELLDEETKQKIKNQTLLLKAGIRVSPEEQRAEKQEIYARACLERDDSLACNDIQLKYFDGDKKQELVDQIITLERKKGNMIESYEGIPYSGDLVELAADTEPEIQEPEPETQEEAKPAVPSYKSAKAALREICEAGVEYSQDGIGTAQQIAHELAYWVIDLHRETGGQASEAALRKAGSDGYMFEDCSKY